MMCYIPLNTSLMVKKNGICKWYYETGVTESEISFVDDRREGAYRSYYENGNVWQEAYYVNDKLNGIVKWFYEDGTLAAEMYYDNGLLEKETRWYYNDGNIKLIENYRGGKLNGLTTGFDIDHKPLFEDYYELSTKIWSKRYNSNGEIIEQEYFNNI